MKYQFVPMSEKNCFNNEENINLISPLTEHKIPFKNLYIYLQVSHKIQK